MFREIAEGELMFNVAHSSLEIRVYLVDFYIYLKKVICVKGCPEIYIFVPKTLGYRSTNEKKISFLIKRESIIYVH